MNQLKKLEKEIKRKLKEHRQKKIITMKLQIYKRKKLSIMIIKSKTWIFKGTNKIYIFTGRLMQDGNEGKTVGKEGKKYNSQMKREYNYGSI